MLLSRAIGESFFGSGGLTAMSAIGEFMARRQSRVLLYTGWW
jgi:hypothetical protein